MYMYMYMYMYISNVSICVCICMYISNVSICVWCVYFYCTCRYDHFSGINRKVQFKLIHKDINNMPLESKSHPIIIIIIIIQLLGPALLLIAKWGGEVTPAGERVAEELGKAFRCMYPGGEGEYSLLPGSGFLRLHSTYRHDLKVLGILHFYNFF